MFTGIIQGTGIIKNKKKFFVAIEVDQKIARAIAKGGSISVDGVCLTVLKRDGRNLFFEFMNSTLQRTTLSNLKVDALVNIEPALLAGQPLGGHFVSGHVDCVGIVKKWQKPYLKIKVPKRLIKYIIPQGSVAVNGVSLTIVKIKGNTFFVALTDYTLEHTNLKNLQKDGKVNIEVDLLAKYLKKLCTPS